MRTNALKHVLTAGLAVMMALGVTGVASAKTRARDYVGVWQLEDRNGSGWDQQINGGWNGRSDRPGDRSDSRRGGYESRNGSYESRDGNYDSRNGSYDSRNGNYDSRNGSYDSRNGNYDSRYGSRGGLRLVSLPQTFRIESDRRDLRLEAMNGQTLREIDFGRNRQLSSQQTMYGATIYETYSLVDHGQRLMIHTTIRGNQGTREMTTVYDRA
jgi:hypothetical protein